MPCFCVASVVAALALSRGGNSLAMFPQGGRLITGSMVVAALPVVQVAATAQPAMTLIHNSDLLSVIFSSMIASSQPVRKYMLAGVSLPDWAAVPQRPPASAAKSIAPIEEGKSSPENQQANLFEYVIQRKDAIQWRTLENPGIFPEICKTLGVNPGNQKLRIEVIGSPTITAGNHRIGKVLVMVWTQDQNQPDIILGHMITRTDAATIQRNETIQDAYYFLLKKDGNLSSVVYAKVKKNAPTTWELFSNALAETIFSQDKKEWHDCLANHTCGDK